MGTEKNVDEITDEEFAALVRGKEVIEILVGECGFDLVFENGLVLETYDLCVLLAWMKEMGEDDGVDCRPRSREEHRELAMRFAGRRVVDVVIDGGKCVFEFVLDDGEKVCVPDAYGYVIDRRL